MAQSVEEPLRFPLLGMAAAPVAATVENASTVVAEQPTAGGSISDVVRTATPTENSSIRHVVACRAGDDVAIEAEQVVVPPSAPSTVALRNLHAGAPEGTPQAAGAAALRIEDQSVSAMSSQSALREPAALRIEDQSVSAMSSQSALREFMAAVSARFESTRLLLDESSPRLAHFAETLSRFESRPCA